MHVCLAPLTTATHEVALSRELESPLPLYPAQPACHPPSYPLPPHPRLMERENVSLHWTLCVPLLGPEPTDPTWEVLPDSHNLIASIDLPRT